MNRAARQGGVSARWASILAPLAVPACALRLPTAPISAVTYDFSIGSSGEYARNFLGDWKGKLAGGDYGYKAGFVLGVTEIG